MTAIRNFSINPESQYQEKVAEYKVRSDIYEGNIGEINFDIPPALPAIPAITGEEITDFRKTYSHDGKYYIAGYDFDYDMEINGLSPVKEIRITEADNGLIIWKIDGLFMLLDTAFSFSLDNRYVLIKNGQSWTEGIILDLTDMSQQTLPGIAELSPMFPTMNDFPYLHPFIIGQEWENNTIFVFITWFTLDSTGEIENSYYGKYVYNITTGAFTSK